ncbi:MAG: InlB B-repeat-containing protein [Ferrovibrionaceae bacterium]
MIRPSLKLAACAVPLVLAAPASAGVILDTTFADTALDGAVNAIAIDSDGKIVVGGSFTQAGIMGRQRLARFNSDGTLDTTFGNPRINGEVNAIAIDRNGKIVVGGSFTAADFTTYNRLARINTDGTLDTTFADPNINSTVFGLAIDGNDKIVVVGDFGAIVGSVNRFGLARFNTDGSADTSMTTDPGIAVTPGGLKASAVVIDSSGRIVVGGDFTNITGTNAAVRNQLARFAANGTLDTTFDPNLNGAVMSLAIDSSDKILVAGDFTAFDAGGTWRERLGRLNANGTPDTGFPDPQIDAQVNALKIDQNGKIVVGGQFTSAGGQSRSIMARFSATGSLDTSFVAPAFTGGGANVKAIATDSSGRLVIGGSFATVGGATRTNLARLTETLSLTVVKAGAGSGVVTSSVGGINCGVTCSSSSIGSGTSVTLTATADSGSTFSGWSGACSGAATTTTFTLSADRSCTATFAVSSAPTPAPSPTPLPQVSVPIETGGTGQGTVSLAQSLGTPAPGTTFTVQQTSGAPLPSWLTFNSSTLSFAYDVPLPSDLPIQPVASADLRATRPAIANRVYPLSVLVQTVPVLLTMTSPGSSASYIVNMTFYAPRSPVIMTAVSYSATGRSGDGVSGRPALSWDGGQILFETAAGNLFSATSPHTKIGRYHGLSGNRDLLSQTAIPGGGVANASNGPAISPSVSANGAWGAFAASGGSVTIAPASTLRQVYRTSLAYPRVSLNEAVTPAPTMVSTSAANVPANAAADNPSLSETGGLVAFESAATNLGSNPAGVVQIWRKDVATGAILLVSSAADGTAANGDSRNVSLSWDGRFAAFESTATNLVQGFSGQRIYLKDLLTGAVFAIAPGSNPKLDARADSLVFATGGDVARFDRATGRVTTVGRGDQPAVSADGRFVVWRMSGDTYTQIWVRDVMRDQTALVSQTAAGSPGGGNSYDPAVSGDGGTISFGSQARDLVNGTPLAGQIHVAANPLLLPGRTDYWYVTAGGNQAWAIERWGDQAYIANLAYRPGGGIATWGAGLCRFDGLVCRGTLAQTGAPVAVTFDQGGNAASLTIGSGVVQPLAIYPIMGTSTTAFAGLPQAGWWYEPARGSDKNGVFLAFDTQIGSNGTVSQTAHLSLLTYDADGTPVWYAAEGVLGADLSLEGTMMRYAGGATIGTTGGAATPSSVAIGTFRLAFAAGDQATLRLPDGRTATLARWRF